MLGYLSKRIVKLQVIEPLNNGVKPYYSIHNDGSSSSKTMDEKELFIMKSAPNGIIQFSIMSLEEPEEANAAEGL